MAIGKYQPFVKGDTIYAMDTETGILYYHSNKYRHLQIVETDDMFNEQFNLWDEE